MNQVKAVRRVGQRMNGGSRVWILGLFAVLLLPGCGEGSDMPEVPEAPDQAVEAVAESMAQGEPIMLWAAMPESYRGDVTEVVHSFADAVDPEVYDKSFAVVSKMADVLSSQKQFILNHPMMANNENVDTDALEANWDQAVGALQTLAGSSVSSIDGLKSLDIAAFLNGEGAAIAGNLQALSAASEENPMAQLANVTAKVVEETDNSVTVEVTNPDGETEREEMVKVEDRWVPAEMAEQWDKNITDAKARITEMKEQGVPNKPQIMGGLTMMESTLDQLQQAENQQQFNQAVNQVMMMVMGPMMGPGGGGPGGGMPGGSGGKPGAPAPGGAQ